MSKIRIKNFGPVKEGFSDDDGFMDIKKVTLFIGDQGSGKSSAAKLISTLKWLEKALYREDISSVSGSEFKNSYCAYQRIQNYFKYNTQIDYEGDAYSFSYSNEKLQIRQIINDKKTLVPKIMYVPAERNFLSSVSDADNVKGLPPPLFTFLDEYDRSLNELKENLDLPIGKMKLEYNQLNKTPYIIGDDYRIRLLEASSGLHSAVPLFLVSQNLAQSIHKEKDPSKINISLSQARRRDAKIEQILANTDIPKDVTTIKVEEIISRYVNSCLVNIVEEPEQNLFPESQRELLFSLFDFANMDKGNELIMTTHSPFTINNLSIAIQGKELLEKLEGANREDLKRLLEKIIPIDSCISAADVIVYQLDNGLINRLPAYEGIPSDKNYLNKSLAEGNHLFDSLLEIEQSI